MPSISLLRSALHKRSSHVGAALVGAAALAIGACADAPSAPSAAPVPRLEFVSASAYAEGLVREQALDRPITTEISVPRQGGRFNLPGGLHILVAPATFNETTTTLSVTALPGDVVAYEFQPHGLVFAKPLLMSQDLRGTNWRGKDIAQFGVGYFENATDLNLLTKQALVKEYLPSFVDLRGQRAYFRVFHFSGYMMSTGRSNPEMD